MAMTRPQPLADHTNIIKRTGENFPKTALASIQLMCLIAKTNQVIRFYVFLREIIAFWICQPPLCCPFFNEMTWK